MSFSSGSPLKPSGVIRRCPNALTRATFASIYPTPQASSPPDATTVSSLHPPSTVSYGDPREAGLSFLPPALHSTLVQAPGDSEGWTSGAPSPSFLDPFLSPRVFSPVSHLPGVPQSLTQNRVDLPNLSSQNPGTVQDFKLGLPLDILGGQPTYRAGKSKTVTGPSTGSVTSSCTNVGSCSTYLGLRSPLISGDNHAPHTQSCSQD